MATIDVKDAAGATVALEKPLAPGRSAAATSRPVALSNEDAAFLDGIETLLTTIDGRVDGLETLITSTNTKLDTAITALQIIDNMVLSAGTANIGDVDVLTVPADPMGANADAASATGSISAKLRGIATALGVTALDTGTGTGGSRTLRFIPDGAFFSPLGQTTKSASAPITIASDQGYAGNVGGITALFDVTLSLDTSAYASGDVLADTQVLTSLFRITDGTGVLQSIQVIDQDDQKQAIDFYYLSANQSLGTENSAPNISDANAVNIVGPFSVAAADYKDLGGVSVAKISNIGQPIVAVSGTANGYIGAICNSGTPTYTASGIKLRIGILRD